MDNFKLEFRSLNELASGYDQSPFDRLMRTYMMRTLEPFLRNGKALEIGCFHGDFTCLLVNRYEDLTVVEAAGEFLEITRARVGNKAQFAHSLIETYDTTERFDAIFLLHVLEHFQDTALVLERAKALLSDRGRIFVIVPNAHAASRRVAVKMGILPELTALSESDIRHGHRRVYSLDTLLKEVREAGLKAIHQGGVFFKPLANFQFDQLIGTEILADSFLEGCFELGREYPDLCASLYAVAERA